MTTPHKHADLIKAWADGAEIETYETGKWMLVSKPNWFETHQYRIKPEPKPDVVRYLNPSQYNGSYKYFEEATVRAVFDGQTGELKSVGKVK